MQLCWAHQNPKNTKTHIANIDKRIVFEILTFLKFGTNRQNLVCGRTLMVVSQESQRKTSLLQGGAASRLPSQAKKKPTWLTLQSHQFLLGLGSGWLTLEMVNMYSCQVWGVLDLYGMTVKVTIVDRDERDEQNLITRQSMHGGGKV